MQPLENPAELTKIDLLRYFESPAPTFFIEKKNNPTKKKTVG